MLMKCGEALDELTVQVWLLIRHLNLRYGTLCKHWQNYMY